jgi:cytochrome c-type biogenesis protein
MDPANLLTDASLLVGIGVAFLFGALSFLSPCVLPLLPGYLSLMSGYSVADLESGEAAKGRVLRGTLFFVGGFSLVFVAIGAAATSVGQFLRLNQVLLTQVAGVVIILFGLVVLASALGKGRWVQYLLRERRLDVRVDRLGSWGAPVMGMAFAFAWTPCIGPVLAAIIVLAGTLETVGAGMVLLAAFSLGLGVPFVLAGLGLSRSFRGLRRHLRTINLVSGSMLVGFGVLMLTNRIGLIAGWVSELFYRLGLEGLATI